MVRTKKSGAAAAECSEEGECPEFGPGWTYKSIKRKGSERSDTYWFSPTKKKFRSKAAIKRFLADEDKSGSDEGSEEEGEPSPAPKSGQKRKISPKKTGQNKKTKQKKTDQKKTGAQKKTGKKKADQSLSSPRPRGRAPKGMTWDGDKGEWIPGSENDDAAAPKSAGPKSVDTLGATPGVQAAVEGLSVDEMKMVLCSIAKKTPQVICSAATSVHEAIAQGSQGKAKAKAKAADPSETRSPALAALDVAAEQVRRSDEVVKPQLLATRALDFDIRPRPSRSGDGKIIHVDDRHPRVGRKPDDRIKFRVMLILKEWEYDLRTHKEKMKLAEGAIRLACYDGGYPSPRGTFAIDRWFKQFRESLRHSCLKKPPRKRKPMTKACDQCKSSKTKCDGKKPCSRCLAAYMKDHELSGVEGVDASLIDCTYSPRKKRGPKSNKEKSPPKEGDVVEGLVDNAEEKMEGAKGEEDRKMAENQSASESKGNEKDVADDRAEEVSGRNKDEEEVEGGVDENDMDEDKEGGTEEAMGGLDEDEMHEDMDEEKEEEPGDDERDSEGGSNSDSEGEEDDTESDDDSDQQEEGEKQGEGGLDAAMLLATAAATADNRESDWMV